MKKLILGTIAAGLLIIGSSCSKNKFCYACNAQGTQPWNQGQVINREECDLSRSDRDNKANDFEANFTAESWNTSCSRTSR